MTRVVGGRYEVLDLLGEGGMGTVYVARHQATHKKCALKIMHPDLAKTEGSVERFLREVRAPAAIDHEGIVEVLDAGVDEDDGTLFFAMELLEGQPLADRLESLAIPLSAKLSLLEQSLIPLAAAHEKGFVHRDLKPENVFVVKKRDGSEVVKLLDFGIARRMDATGLTQTGVPMGTVYYMSPEQARSARGVSPTADVWAFGIMLYEALTGELPFNGETVGDIIVKLCTEPHPDVLGIRPLAPPPLVTLIDLCLQKDPEKRPADATALLRALHDAQVELSSLLDGDRLTDPDGLGESGATVAEDLSGSRPLDTSQVFEPTDSFQEDAATRVEEAMEELDEMEMSQPFRISELFDASESEAIHGLSVRPAQPAGDDESPSTVVYEPDGGGRATPALPGPEGAGRPTPSVPGEPDGEAASQAAPEAAAPEAAAPSPAAPSPAALSPGLPPPPSAEGRGGRLAALVAVGVIVVGGGIAVLGIQQDWFVGERTSTSAPGVVETAHARVLTEITDAELYVDGASFGPLFSEQELSLAAGSHRFEARRGDETLAVAEAMVSVSTIADVQLVE